MKIFNSSIGFVILYDALFSNAVFSVLKICLWQVLIYIFNFSYPHMVEKVLFLSQIFKIKILINIHCLRFSGSDNHIFSDWSLSLSVCASFISINEKQIIEEIGNLLWFFICNICKWYLKTFYENLNKNLCTGTKKRIQTVLLLKQEIEIPWLFPDHFNKKILFNTLAIFDTLGILSKLYYLKVLKCFNYTWYWLKFDF